MVAFLDTFKGQIPCNLRAEIWSTPFKSPGSVRPCAASQKVCGDSASQSGSPQTRVLEVMTFRRHVLVGGWATPLKNMSSSVGIIIPNIWKNKTCSKPNQKSHGCSVWNWSAFMVALKHIYGINDTVHTPWHIDDNGILMITQSRHG